MSISHRGLAVAIVCRRRYRAPVVLRMRNLILGRRARHAHLTTPTDVYSVERSLSSNHVQLHTNIAETKRDRSLARTTTCVERE